MLLSKKVLTIINEKFAKCSTQQIIDGLNAIGIEVEKVYDSKINSDLKLGRLLNSNIINKEKQISLCEVDILGNKYKIVCGARDIKNNQWVIVALPGTKLSADKIIEEKEMYGVVSQGMICSLVEAMPNMAEYISDYDANTIFQIPFKSNINSFNFFDDYGFNDIIFDISIPSNRPELNGVYILAYELNLQFNDFHTKIPKNSNLFGYKIKPSETIKVSLDKKFSYSLLEVKFNHTIENYLYTKLSLINSGIKARGNNSDYGLMAQLLFAHPIIPINKELSGDELTVTILENHEEFIDQDNKTYDLAPGTIVTINSDKEIVSVTGLLLSNKFVADQSTTSFYFEMALLPVDYINKFLEDDQFTKNYYASYYLKNPSDSVMEFVLAWFTKNSELKKLTDFTKVHYSYINDSEKSILVKSTTLSNLLGVDIGGLKISSILKKVGIGFFAIKVTVPAYRKDINNHFDVVEELLKFVDINKLRVQPINFSINSFVQKDEFQQLNEIRNFLINKQFIEVKTYNLTSEKHLNDFNWFELNDIEVNNPISNERKYLRKNLVHELLNVFSYNLAHSQKLTNIFEIQKINYDLLNSSYFLTCLVTNDCFVNPIDSSSLKANDYTNKALYDAIENLLGLRLKREFNVQNIINIYDVNNFLIQNKNNDLVGVVGQIKNSLLLDEYKIPQNVYVISINLDLALKNVKSFNNVYKVSDLNPVYKEITFTNNDNIDLRDVIKKMMEVSFVKGASLIDFFEKDNLKSYTIQIKIQPKIKSFTADEISNIFQKAIKVLRQQGLVVREQ